jgi:hypothetical protein
MTHCSSLNEGPGFNSAGPFVFNSHLPLSFLLKFYKSMYMSPAREYLVRYGSVG